MFTSICLLRHCSDRRFRKRWLQSFLWGFGSLQIGKAVLWTPSKLIGYRYIVMSSARWLASQTLIPRWVKTCLLLRLEEAIKLRDSRLNCDRNFASASLILYANWFLNCCGKQSLGSTLPNLPAGGTNSAWIILRSKPCILRYGIFVHAFRLNLNFGYL